MKRIQIGPIKLPLPASRILRVSLGLFLILCGFLGFLPILGFWMIPLGILILSADIVLIRKARRQILVRYGRAIKQRWPRLWNMLNGNNNGQSV